MKPDHKTALQVAKKCVNDEGYSAFDMPLLSRAYLDLRERNKWRPIESVPKDGTWIMVWGGNAQDEAEERSVAVARWTTNLNSNQVDGYWQFACYDGGFYGEYVRPTHWKPLDTPSEDE